MTVKSRSTPSTPSRPVTAPVTRFWISLRSGQPATVSAIVTPTAGRRWRCAHHVQVDDAAVQLGVLDRARQGVEDLGFGDGHGRSRRGSAGLALRR